jgi:hypothetical protein
MTDYNLAGVNYEIFPTCRRTSVSISTMEMLCQPNLPALFVSRLDGKDHLDTGSGCPGPNPRTESKDKTTETPVWIRVSRRLQHRHAGMIINSVENRSKTHW